MPVYETEPGWYDLYPERQRPREGYAVLEGCYLFVTDLDRVAVAHMRGTEEIQLRTPHFSLALIGPGVTA